MEPVAVHGDLIALTHAEKSPIVLVITRRRRVGIAVKFAVGDGDVAARLEAHRDHLTANVRHLDVIDPQVVGSVDVYGIAAPYKPRIQISDVNVLHNHVVDIVNETQARAPEDALVANTKDGLVGPDIDAHRLGPRRSVLASGFEDVNGPLSFLSAVRRTPIVRADRAVLAVPVTSDEVVFLIEKNRPWCVVREPGMQFVDVCWNLGRRISTSRGVLPEAQWLANVAGGTCHISRRHYDGYDLREPHSVFRSGDFSEEQYAKGL